MNGSILILITIISNYVCEEYCGAASVLTPANYEPNKLKEFVVLFCVWHYMSEQELLLL
jgi:hypothetical protein